jgi:hypothetical protein
VLTFITHTAYARTRQQWAAHPDYLADLDRRTVRTDEAGRWIDFRGIVVPRGKTVPVP